MAHIHYSSRVALILTYNSYISDIRAADDISSISGYNLQPMYRVDPVNRHNKIFDEPTNAASRDRNVWCQ